MDTRNENTTSPPAQSKRVRLGNVGMRKTGVSELSLIASVNEAIKQSILASQNINMIAVNANLKAVRAGKRAAGFGVVAGELRRFSDNMAQTMQGWSGLIYDLVNRTAQSRNQARRMRTLLAAGRCSPKAQQVIAAASQRSREKLDAMTSLNSEKVLALRTMIIRAEKQYIAGEMIARSSLIESAYGGTMRPVLHQMATEIDASIARFNVHSQNVGKLMQRVAA